MIFRDRVEAGRKLADALETSDAVQRLRTDNGLIVLAIPRGGVVVGAEVARRLGAPLDVWMAHKIGAPGNREFAIGSVSLNGELTLDHAIIAKLGIPSRYVEEEAALQSRELARRMIAYRGHAEPVRICGKAAIVVDDGVATGATALAALQSLRRTGAVACILAAPVAPLDTMPALMEAADAVAILHTPEYFGSVGQFYFRFEQVSDEEVIQLLSQRVETTRKIR